MRTELRHSFGPMLPIIGGGLLMLPVRSMLPAPFGNLAFIVVAFIIAFSKKQPDGGGQSARRPATTEKREADVVCVRCWPRGHYRLVRRCEPEEGTTRVIFTRSST